MWMSRGKQEDQWNHTALLAAMIANSVRDPKKKRKPYQPEDFLPFKRKRKASSGGKEGFKALRALIGTRHGGTNPRAN